jgi:hypothetical protein
MPGGFVKRGWLENPPDHFPTKISIHGGFPLATFDYQRVNQANFGGSPSNRVTSSRSASFEEKDSPVYCEDSIGEFAK